MTADLCVGCNGIWFDGAELAQVSPALGGLPERRAEIAAAGRASGIACPRCSARMTEVELLDVPLDICEECAGVWLDGGEYEALARAADREEGLPAPPAAQDRSAAAKAQRTRAVACKQCGVTAPLEKTYLTAMGLVCAGCYLSADREAMDEKARKEHAEFAGKVREAPERYAGSSYELPATVDGAKLVFGILGVLLSDGRCSRCGCRHGSRCGHG